VRFEEPFERGLSVFEEKDDLLPFEEAKLYGHNAVHALAACLGRLRGAVLVSDLPDLPGMMAFLREAFLLESGEALIRKHRGVDPLFTPEGYAAYADDLLARMTNVFLMDTVERVGRDLARKLTWDDRLIGTMRLALGQGVAPRRFAVGAAAAFAALDSRFLDGGVSAAELALPLWRADPAPAGEREKVLALVEGGRALLRRWRAAGFPDLQKLLEREDAR
jgi:mannitol-1-phosphate 5-dehydrogenase